MVLEYLHLGLYGKKVKKVLPLSLRKFLHFDVTRLHIYSSFSSTSPLSSRSSIAFVDQLGLVLEHIKTYCPWEFEIRYRGSRKIPRFIPQLPKVE